MMKKTTKIENTLGMFDLLKGIAMFLIVFAHNRSIFPELIFDKASAIEGDSFFKTMPYIARLPVLVRLVMAVLAPIALAMVPAFLIIGGYGFRKRNVSKTIKLFSKEMIKPYVYTVIATVLLHCLLHFVFFRYWPGAIKESLKVFAGMVLGLTQTTTFGKITFFANGPVWFLLAMFWSVVIFNMLLNWSTENALPFYVFIASVVGWLLSYVKYTPWCISQGLVGIIYVYIGYYLKKNKVFSKEYNIKEKFIYVIAVVLPNFVLCAFGLVTEMADNVYSLGPISYIENGLFGILVLYMFLRLNILHGRIAGGIRTVGKYSLYMMCVHSVEMIAIPWYKLSELFYGKPMIGFFAIYIARMIIIIGGVFLVVKINDTIKSITQRKDVLNKK